MKTNIELARECQLLDGLAVVPSQVDRYTALVEARMMAKLLEGAQEPTTAVSLQCAHCQVTIEQLNDKVMYLMKQFEQEPRPPNCGTGHCSCIECHDPAYRAMVRGEAQPAQEPLNALPDDIRSNGWAVAVHNDYRLYGENYTFWLFTKDGMCVKGEGLSDTEALNQVREAIKERGIGGKA
jgi:hypothetical protein